MNTSPTERHLARRIVAAACVAFGICFFATVASVDVPLYGTDAELLAWWGQDASLVSGMVSMAFAIATAVLFSVVTGHVLLRAGDRCAPLVSFARTTSTAFTVTLLVSAAFRGVVGRLVKVEERPLPGLDVLDYSTALNYTMLSVIVMACFALTVAALGGLVLRLGLLARWHGFVGVGVGVVVLGAVVAMVGEFTVPIAILWALCTAVAVWQAPGTGAAAEDSGRGLADVQVRAR